jgi:hypothetical protein
MGLLLEATVDNVDQRTVSGDSVQVCRLTLLCLRLVTDTRCEVLHLYQVLGRLEEAKSQFLQVQPQVLAPVPGLETVVEVEAVHVSLHPLHWPLPLAGTSAVNWACTPLR